MGARAHIECQRLLLDAYRRASAAAEPYAEVVRPSLEQARALAIGSDAPEAAETFNRYLSLFRLKVRDGETFDDLSIEPGTANHSVPGPDTGESERLPPIEAEGEHGISLVTACMNRNANLCRALESWLRHDEIDEIVIVDWSSAKPVKQDLEERGIHDPRIRVARVEGEPRWILTYAFNVGFRLARFDQILKADADIVLSADFFARNALDDGAFIAGNWRTAVDGQEHVNGFFMTSRAALAAVGGFNEFITTYGWDDDDLYTRLTAAGWKRVDVAAGTVTHLDHTDEERFGESPAPEKVQSARDVIKADPLYRIRRNRYIANVMPSWKSHSPLLGFAVDSVTNSRPKLRRDDHPPIRVPRHIQRRADFVALWELASWRLGPRVRELDESGLDKLLDKPFEQIGKIDIETAIAVPGSPLPAKARYCIANMTDVRALRGSNSDLIRIADTLDELAKALTPAGFRVAVRAPVQKWPEGVPTKLSQYPLIPAWVDIGASEIIPFAEALNGLPEPDKPIQVDLDAALAETRRETAPHVLTPRNRIFIDAQHGLGNRLRAIGSAAAIAEATDRELVIVWEPDHHCDCRFEDLFDYAGAVLDTRFVDEAESLGCDVFNYMTAEPDAQKDAPIVLDDGRGVYARSAFVLNSEHSHWAAENAFIQSLTPVEMIRDLVAGVRNPNDVTAHIRMEGGKQFEHLPYESAENWTQEDHDLIAKWRAKSHFEHFMTRIDQLNADGCADRVFVAADRPETYDAFKDRYGARVAFLPRTAYDRSAEQLRYAMADAILLSRAPLMLGSTWSSFSELAMRLAPGGIDVEMSGKDF
jgi:glycosyltransferase involved in cell wall biosynthesis